MTSGGSSGAGASVTVSNSPATGRHNMNTNIHGIPSSQDQSISRHITPESSNYEKDGLMKRKMDSMDPTDSDYLSQNKIPKIETNSSPQTNSSKISGRALSTENINHLGSMSGGCVKLEMKPELKQESDTDPSSLHSHQRRMMSPMMNPDENFLEGLGGAGGESALTTEQQQPPVDPKTDKHKTNTAAKIRTALEASGLAGNLTPEDLQTLKRLNEIAKSTGLSQEQKSNEASQLLKNNPNVSRLLLKLRTSKNMENKDGPAIGQIGPGGPGGQPNGQLGPNSGRSPGPAAGMQGRASPATNPMPPSYSNYGQQQQQQQNNNNNYYLGTAGQTGGPGSPGYYRGGPGGFVPGADMQHMAGPGAGHMRPMMPSDMGPGGYAGNFGPMGPVRGGNNMYGPGMGPAMMERMHPSHMNMGPRTMYIRDRNTGMLMPDYGPGAMMGPRSGGPGPGFVPGNVPPPYISPGGYHPNQHGMMASPRRMVSPMMAQGGPAGGHYGDMGPGGPSTGIQRPNNSLYPMNHDYDGFNGGSGPGPMPVGNNFREFRENSSSSSGGGGMLGQKFPVNDYNNSSPRPGPGPIPPHTGSQLRARLSQPGPAGSGVTSGGSELANRLLHGKPPSDQHQQANNFEYNNINNFQNGNNLLKAGSEALFDEIDNSQFDYSNSLDNTNECRSSQNYNLDNNDFIDDQAFDTWKNSAATNEVRSTMLRKLSTAIESSQTIPPTEAAKLAHQIENKAFSVAGSLSDYQTGIAHHLAKIFSQSKAAAAQVNPEEVPDSTTWQDQGCAPSNSSPDSSQSYSMAPAAAGQPAQPAGSSSKSEGGPHFPSDTTLNCFQV